MTPAAVDAGDRGSTTANCASPDLNLEPEFLLKSVALELKRTTAQIFGCKIPQVESLLHPPTHALFRVERLSSYSVRRRRRRRCALYSSVHLRMAADHDRGGPFPLHRLLPPGMPPRSFPAVSAAALCLVLVLGMGVQVRSSTACPSVAREDLPRKRTWHPITA